MIFRTTPITGAFLIELEPRSDQRGSLARCYCQREFQEHAAPFHVVQANLVRTGQAGTIRGLHYVEHPNVEQKLVRCISGEIMDVIVDMRPDSPTRLKHVQVRLDAKSGLALFVPTGVAHGYQTLTDDTECLYMTDAFYRPGCEVGVRYDDPALGIEWPLAPCNMIPRDTSWPHLN